VWHTFGHRRPKSLPETLIYAKIRKFEHKMRVLSTKVTYLRSRTLKISPRGPQSDLGVDSKRFEVLPKRAQGIPSGPQGLLQTLQKRSKKGSKTTPGDFSKNDRLQVAKTPLFTTFLKGPFSKTPLFTTFS